MTRCKVGRPLFIVALFCFLSIAASAEEVTIAGYVLGPDGEPVADARVLVEYVKAGGVPGGTTDLPSCSEDGLFALSIDVAFREYPIQIAALKPGYALAWISVTGEQDRVGVAQIARDKAYRKLADWICWERHGIPYNSLKDRDARVEIDEEVKTKRGGLAGSCMVSDAFFPFRDGVDVGIREGVTAVVQPGGSQRDFESIEACNEANVAMVFTGQRSFKH